MDDYEFNYIVLRTILGFCLSNINKLIPLWHYNILLPEKEEEYSLSFLLNVAIFELKKILEPCSLITIKDNNIKCVIDTSGHGGNYSWSIFLLENSLSTMYFAKMSFGRYNEYQRNVYFIGLGNYRDTKINPSSRFHFKKPRKYCELKRLLNE